MIKVKAFYGKRLDGGESGNSPTWEDKLNGFMEENADTCTFVDLKMSTFGVNNIIVATLIYKEAK